MKNEPIVTYFRGTLHRNHRRLRVRGAYAIVGREYRGAIVLPIRVRDGAAILEMDGAKLRVEITDRLFTSRVAKAK